MVLPKFILVGTAKSGTTSLLYYLRDHPEIYMPVNEMHFFDIDENYNKGLKWYESNFKHFNQEKCVGEKTPSYSYVSKCPQRIAEILPNIKLIWLLRNPVDRTYSNYWHAIKHGIEHLSFESALKKEKQRITKNIWLGYRERSIYIKQIKRFLKFYSISNMFFLLFEDLLEKPIETIKKVYEFLDVDNSYIPSKDYKENITFIPRNISFQWLARKIFIENNLSNHLLERILKNTYLLIDKHNKRKIEGYPKLDNEIREKLLKFFKPYNIELEKITGLNLKNWK